MLSLAHAREETAIAVERAYRRALRAEQAATVATAALEAQRAGVAVARDKERQGIVAASFRLTADAELAEAELAVLVSSVDRTVARAELDRAVGGQR